jgi:two-component system, NtrC family, nitrogen regulation response regulator GlnG
VVEAKDLPPELMAALPLQGAAEAPVPTAGTAGAPPLPASAAAEPAPAQVPSWLGDLEREARRRLDAGEAEVWDVLTRQFEGRLIHTALELTRGRRIEAAQRLGIGRNTITRKIQELGLDD